MISQHFYGNTGMKIFFLGKNYVKRDRGGLVGVAQ